MSSRFIRGPWVFNSTTVKTSSGDVTCINESQVIVKKDSGAATAVTLPASPMTGQTVIVKDGKGDAATNNITVAGASGNIDGAASYVISTNYAAVAFTYNGTEWGVSFTGQGGGSGGSGLFNAITGTDSSLGITGQAGSGTGAAGGAIALTGGAGTNHTTGTGGAGGAVTRTGGAAGTATSGTGGAGGAVTNTGAAGGAATTGTGGAGGAVTSTAGAGGAASAAAGTGGVGGAASLTAGAGGAASHTAATAAGVGGAASLVSGAGGASSTTAVAGGAGGALSVTGGAGGAGAATGTGGAGATIAIAAGAGGATSGAGTGGAGGNVTIAGGAGGTTSGGTTGARGIVTVTGLRTVAGSTAVAITGATTLTLADSGGIFTVAQSSAYDIDLPSPTSGPGLSYFFSLTAPGAFNVTLTVAGGAATFVGSVITEGQIVVATGSTLTFASGVCVLGDSIEIRSIATNLYHVRAVSSILDGITIA